MNIVNRAVVLAAGLGTRLKWMTHSKPKALIQVGDETAIEHVIRRLAGQGIDDIAINVHHHAEKLMQHLGDGSHLGVRLYYSYEQTLLDSGGGVRKAMQLLPGSGSILVHNADVITDINLHLLTKKLPDGGATLSLVANPLHHPDGDFSLNHNMVRVDGEPRYTYAGVSLWSEAALLEGNSDTFSLVKPMQQLIEQGRLTGCIHHGFWFDIGRPRDLIQARRFIQG